MLDRALSTMKGEVIELTDLPLPARRHLGTAELDGIAPIREVQADAEKAALVAALKKTANNKARAAALRGIHRTLLYKKMKRHGVPLSGLE
jgi:transcriptional regulator of acetoin/glycerol metabolism